MHIRSVQTLRVNRFTFGTQRTDVMANVRHERKADILTSSGLNFLIEQQVNKMISKVNAEHYVWGDKCDGWYLVNRQDMLVIHEKMPPKTYEK